MKTEQMRTHQELTRAKTMYEVGALDAKVLDPSPFLSERARALFVPPSAHDDCKLA